MYTTNYKDCKSYLERSLPSTLSAQQTINPPMCEDTAIVSLRDKGLIRERICCPFHQYFEWDLHREYFDFSQYLDVTSPVFKVDLQSFYLELSPKCSYTLRLYRLGPSVKDDIYAWRAGIFSYQDSDNSPFYDGRVNLSEELAEWTDVEQLFTLSSSYLRNSCGRPDGNVTFYFRTNIIPMNIEKKVPIVREPCNNGALRTTATSTGSIVEKEWEMYKKVQWDIPCKSIKDCPDNSGSSALNLYDLSSPNMVYKSPVFEISNQTFYLSLEISRVSSTPHCIRLYRLGPSVDMTVRWWIQLKNGSNCIFASKNMDLSRSCVVWTYDERLVSFEQMSKSSFTVEFLMSKVDTICGVIQSTVGEESPLDLDPSRTEFISFRALCHDFTVHRSLITMRVPVFEAMLSHDTIENQTGVLCLDDCEPVVIAMFLHYVDTGNGPLWSEIKFPELSIHFTAGLFVVADKYLLPELRDMCLSLLEEISLLENSEHWKTVSFQVGKLVDILSTFPPETLKKWPMIEYFHSSDANN